MRNKNAEARVEDLFTYYYTLLTRNGLALPIKDSYKVSVQHFLSAIRSQTLPDRLTADLAFAEYDLRKGSKVSRHMPSKWLLPFKSIPDLRRVMAAPINKAAADATVGAVGYKDVAVDVVVVGIMATQVSIPVAVPTGNLMASHSAFGSHIAAKESDTCSANSQTSHREKSYL